MALSPGDLTLSLGPVLPFRLDKMIVAVAAAGVHIGIAGILLLGALIVGRNVADFRSLVFGETKDMESWSTTSCIVIPARTICALILFLMLILKIPLR